ncbi:MAG: stage II sporulation protein M [Opitutaceae bacterium]|nr:stage II sporulation protein M [Opitutaceae bacterium]
MSTNPDFDKPRKHYAMRTEEKFTRDNQKRGQEDPNTPNDVWAWRQDQRKIEKQAGVDDLGELKDYRQKRRRDFWTVIILNNVFFGGMMGFYQGNPVVLIYGFAGILIGTVGTYWILYHLMRKY